ncbi:hypothetical protein CTI12_AA088610 [Artemisia annua]|uniref:Replication factor A C-terminal domain-containing protein n=1 Tax=Artemisia annua TaxID=35608 RepID=A0A2U1Q107_ARTAN|nr:hypothetical protein CTI12_AA088610 [Artemisia annua]
MSRRLVASDFVDPYNNNMLSSIGSNGFKENAFNYDESTLGINNTNTPAHFHIDITETHTSSATNVTDVNYPQWSAHTAKLQQQQLPPFIVRGNQILMSYSESNVTCASSTLKPNVREVEFPTVSNYPDKQLKVAANMPYMNSFVGRPPASAMIHDAPPFTCTSTQQNSPDIYHSQKRKGSETLKNISHAAKKRKGVHVSIDSSSTLKDDTIPELNNHNENPLGPTFPYHKEGLLNNKGKNVVVEPPKYLHQHQPSTVNSINDNYIQAASLNTDNYISTHENVITNRQSRSRYRHAQQPHVNYVGQGTHATSERSSNKGVSQLYIDIGDCDYTCHHCNAIFWYGERSGTTSQSQRIKYTKCCAGGQLYNVVGARQYQLPTSGTLGAIVLEPDTNTQTDYDVIIEYRDRRPQRINKLHSSYMSLQFPLLFVYGQPGYNTKMILEEGTKNRKRNKLTMNMYYKYQIHERYNQMADSSMTAIQASDKKNVVEIEATIKDLRPRDRHRVLEAKVYRAWIARDPPDTNEKDYIGCYINSGRADTIGNPNKDQMVMRKVEIQNLNRISIELTLWDDLAEAFKKDEIDRLERPILIAITSCRVTRFRNNLQLSSTPASYYYINPRIPQLEEYRAQYLFLILYLIDSYACNRYKEMFNLKPPLEIVRQPYKDREKEKFRNRFPLALLLSHTPKTYEGVRFTCEGTITNIHTSKDWYYPSCTTCTLKAQYDDGIYECKVHGALAYPTHRYNFKASLTDGTATATITFFTPKANDIVGIDCASLLASLNNPDPRSGTSEKQYDTTSENKPESQELVAAIEYPFTETANMTAETPPTTVTQVLPAVQVAPEDINKDLPIHQHPLTATEYAFAPPRAMKTEILSTTETQGDKAVELPQDNPAGQPNDPANTPPHQEAYLATASSKSSTPNTGKPTASKRALFQGKTADAKKNKKE